MKYKRLFLAGFTVLSSILILNGIPCNQVFAQEKAIELKMAVTCMDVTFIPNLICYKR